MRGIALGSSSITRWTDDYLSQHVDPPIPHLSSPPSQRRSRRTRTTSVPTSLTLTEHRDRDRARLRNCCCRTDAYMYPELCPSTCHNFTWLLNQTRTHKCFAYVEHVTSETSLYHDVNGYPDWLLPSVSDPYAWLYDRDSPGTHPIANIWWNHGLTQTGLHFDTVAFHQQHNCFSSASHLFGNSYIIHW
jgi:hypothetical protein